jgi:predicted RNase H-like HicB family nuclease
MKTYLALVHKDEGSAYGLSFPDIPGCFSAADDYVEIIPKAAEALDLWFEDTVEIEPRGLEFIRAEVMEDLKGGAFLVAIPYVRRTTRQTRVNISLDTGTLDAIDHAAKSLSLTRSAFIAMSATNQIRNGLR